MAGIGAAPADVRRRRNEPARGDWVDLPVLEVPVLPELPEGEWTMAARRLWDAWRQDPVSAQWSPADVAMAWDTIELRNVMTPSMAGEVRRRMDGLGLTPKGKRDLRWRIPAADIAPQGRAPVAGSAERRSRLSLA